MQLGCFTSGYRYLPLECAFSDAASFGYDYIELWGGRPHAYPPDLKSGGLCELLRLRDRYQMPIRVFTPEQNAYPYNFMLGGETQRAESMAYLKLAMDMGQAMGAEYTVISAGHAGYSLTPDARWGRLIRCLKELASYAEKLGHPLLLEPLTHFESNVCTTYCELLKALDRVNSPFLFGMCDVVAPFVQGEQISGYPRLLRNRLRHVHLVDSDGASETHLLPGDGIMPLGRILTQLREEGYDGTATIELVSAYLNDPSRYAKLGLERIKALLKGERDGTPEEARCRG